MVALAWLQVIKEQGEISKEEEAVQLVVGHFLEIVGIYRMFFTVKLIEYLGHGSQVGWW